MIVFHHLIFSSLNLIFSDGIFCHQMFFFFLFNFNRSGDEVLCNRFDLIFFNFLFIISIDQVMNYFVTNFCLQSDIVTKIIVTNFFFFLLIFFTFTCHYLNLFTFNHIHKKIINSFLTKSIKKKKKKSIQSKNAIKLFTK